MAGHGVDTARCLKQWRRIKSKFALDRQQSTSFAMAVLTYLSNCWSARLHHIVPCERSLLTCSSQRWFATRFVANKAPLRYWNRGVVPRVMITMDQSECCI